MLKKVNLVDFDFMLTSAVFFYFAQSFLPLESLFSYMSMHRQFQDLGGNIANQIVL